MSTDEVIMPKRPLNGMTRQEHRRLERESKRTKGTMPIIHLVECPACLKKRHTKYEDEDGNVAAVKQDIITVRGEQRFIDVCQHCAFKYRVKDERFMLENLKKLQRAAINRDDKTTDKDFSIDL